MDRPDLEADQHRRALQGLAKLNSLSRSVGLLWPASPSWPAMGRPVRILDIATGGGDVPLGLWRRGQKTGVAVEIWGIDISPCRVGSGPRPGRTGEGRRAIFPG